MHRIGIMGERESILAFNAAGIEIRLVGQAQEAARELHKMAEEGFAIIYITEQTAREIPAAIKAYRNRLLPAIIPVPGNRGTLGIGMDGIKNSVERAVGADILFRNG
jgi:V/A-type H+-transporting ATPase subunit F